MKVHKFYIIEVFCLVFALGDCNTAFSQAEKLPYYKKAIEYIKEDNFVTERYGGWIKRNGDSAKYFVSKEVLYFNPDNFKDEIISFQFDHLDNLTKTSIEAFLDNTLSENVYRTDSLLSTLNYTSEPNLIFFFSRILSSGDYKIFTATIHIIDGTGFIGDKAALFKHDFYTEYTFASNITFLFYMDDTGEIVKVFTKQFAD